MICAGTRVKPDLCSLSAEEARSLWISGVHFQRSLRGAGSSLTLAALTSFDGLPLLMTHGNIISVCIFICKVLLGFSKHTPASITNTFCTSVTYMYLSRYSVHCTRTIPSNAECSHTTPQQPSAPTTNWHRHTIQWDSPRVKLRCSMQSQFRQSTWAFCHVLHLHVPSYTFHPHVTPCREEIIHRRSPQLSR